jgi:hypothetical protein
LRGDTGRDLRIPRDFRGGRSQDFTRSGPRGFRGAPSREVFGASPRELRSFQGRSITQFNPQQREAWTHGTWRHARHNGHFGWWWFFNDFWFFYQEPIYPFPTYVGDYYGDDYYGSDNYSYWCDDPRGYYPYVQECYDDWIPVPPQPY